jgi:hypothetical protein
MEMAAPRAAARARRPRRHRILVRQPERGQGAVARAVAVPLGLQRERCKAGPKDAS